MPTYLRKLPDDAVQIEGSFDYIDPRGNVYFKERRSGRGNLFGVKTQQTVYGYKYCGISYIDGRHITKRVHRLVAEAFIPNPYNLPIVMHVDNNKKNNHVSNLKWGTISENTQQAFDNRLIINDKGWDDSQSFPVDQYDTATNKLIAEYGSVSKAAMATGITKGGILFQCRNIDTKIRKPTYFVFHGESPRVHDIIVAYDMETDVEIGRFANTRLAEEYFGITNISDMIYRGKPKWSKCGAWFARITIK